MHPRLADMPIIPFSVLFTLICFRRCTRERWFLGFSRWSILNRRKSRNVSLFASGMRCASMNIMFLPIILIEQKNYFHSFIWMFEAEIRFRWTRFFAGESNERIETGRNREGRGRHISFAADNGCSSRRSAFLLSVHCRGSECRQDGFQILELHISMSARTNIQHFQAFSFRFFPLSGLNGGQKMKQNKNVRYDNPINIME